MSSENSRNTKRTLPLSIYFDFSIGKRLSWKAAQCGQLIDAYSRMVTGAFWAPSGMSGSDGGFAPTADVALCAMASLSGLNCAKPAMAASPANDKAVAKARRITTINSFAPKRACLPQDKDRSPACNDHSGNGRRGLPISVKLLQRTPYHYGATPPGGELLPAEDATGKRSFSDAYAQPPAGHDAGLVLRGGIAAAERRQQQGAR